MSVVQEPQHLQLLLDWKPLSDTRREIRAGIASLVIHVLLIGYVSFSRPSLIQLPPREAKRETVVRRVTPLIAPPTLLTQKAPNRGKVAEEVRLENLLPKPAVQAQVKSPSTTRPAAPRPAPPVPAEAPKLPPRTLDVPPPPQIETTQVAQNLPQVGENPVVPPPPRPQTQQQEKPKIAFERPGLPSVAPRGEIEIPRPSIREVISGTARQPTSGGIVVGDLGEGAGGLGTHQNLPPSPPRMGSNLELLSDPMGVDFRPYLIRVLSAVRRNWMAVIPESARLGQRGKVVLQFAIARNGRVAKVVFISEAGPGAQALDRAAVASISASDPFPPLPPEFRGDQVRLQVAFLYNIEPR